MKDQERTALATLASVLGRVLPKLGFKNVAWRGPEGDNYYAHAPRYSRSLASLASLAQSDLALCHLAAGWQRARACVDSDPLKLGPQPLLIVVQELSFALLDTLERLQESQVELILIFLDAQRRYVDKLCASKGEALLSYPGAFAAAHQLLYPPPVECQRVGRVLNTLALLGQEPGVKIFHLLGPQRPKVQTPPAPPDPSLEKFRALFQEEPEEPKVRKLPLGEVSLERLALTRIAHDLQERPLVTCLWTRDRQPGPFQELGARLQLAPVEGVFLQAVGLAACGIHPLIVIAAADLPRLMNDLFTTAPFPITFLVTDAGLTAYGDQLPNANLHDLSLLSNCPQLNLAVPADEEEARSMLLLLLSSSQPGVLRLSNAPAVGIPSRPTVQPRGDFRGRCLQEGSDLAFICLGSSAYYAVLASRTLESWGFRTAVYNMGWLNPLDRELLAQAARCPRLITVEEHALQGGLATAVSQYLVQAGLEGGVRLRSVGLKSELYSASLEEHGLSMAGLIEQARELLDLRSP